MTRYIPPTIESYGGITPYLNATKNEHNGYDADDLLKNWRWGIGKHMNITALSVLFSVSWPTMAGWVDRLHDEAGKPRPIKKVANSSDIDNNAK